MDEQIIEREDIPECMLTVERVLDWYDWHCDTNNEYKPISISKGDSCIIMFKGTEADCDELNFYFGFLSLMKHVQRGKNEDIL